MRDYSDWLKCADDSPKSPWSRESADDTRVWRENHVADLHAFREHPIGFAYGLLSRKRVLVREDYRVFVMNDGVVYASSFQYAGRIYESRIVHVAWKDAYLVNVADGRVTIERRGQRPIAIPEKFDERSLKSFVENVDIRQRTGDLPQNVPFVYKEIRGSEPKSRSFRKIAVSTLQFILVLAVAAIGYPLFQGGGSLVAGVLPPLAEIAPDAVKLAISHHPEWPFMQKLELTAGAGAFHAAPAEWLTNAMGVHGNRPEFLLLVPVFWATKFMPRDKQVDLLASVIEDQVKRAAKQGQTAASAEEPQ